jgi:hypothetical protein
MVTSEVSTTVPTGELCDGCGDEILLVTMDGAVSVECACSSVGVAA